MTPTHPDPAPRPVLARPVVLGPVAILLFLLALLVDHPLHAYLAGTTWHDGMMRGAAATVLRAPGNWPLVALTIVALVALHPRPAWAAGAMAAAIVVAGTIVGVLKGGFGRARPGTWPGTPEWVFFRGGWYGFFHQTNVSFVSGDVTQAFAWAECLAVAVPKLRWPAYAWALLTAVQRVTVGAHWPSDAVGGAVLGIVTARLMCRIFSALRPPKAGRPIDALPQ